MTTQTTDLEELKRVAREAIAALIDPKPWAWAERGMRPIPPVLQPSLSKADAILSPLLDLERAAEAVDCGGDCETAWREPDTNATGCTKSESEEGCPFELATDLREIAKAIRIQAWTLAFAPPASKAEGELEVLRGQVRSAVDAAQPVWSGDYQALEDRAEAAELRASKAEERARDAEHRAELAEAAAAAIAEQRDTAHEQRKALVERLQAIIDWADFALNNPDEFNSHGVRNLDGPVFDEARAALSETADQALPKGEGDIEKERASILLEAAWEAISELGVTDHVAEDILIPAILKADSDPEYAHAEIAEMRAAVPAPPTTKGEV